MVEPKKRIKFVIVMNARMKIMYAFVRFIWASGLKVAEEFPPANIATSSKPFDKTQARRTLARTFA